MCKNNDCNNNFLGDAYCSLTTDHFSLRKTKFSCPQAIANCFLLALDLTLPPYGNICRLPITFANSLDPDQARQNISQELDINCLTLKVFLKIFFGKS